MGFRFSKRIKILPGVRVNVGKHGASLSIGPRGASVTMGRNGIHGNVGLPGTGLSYRTRLDAGSTAPRKEAPVLPPRVTAIVDQDRIVFADPEGTRLDASLHAAARRAMKDELRTFLDQVAVDRNLGLEALGQLHHDVPGTVSKAVPQPGKPERDSYLDQQAYMAALMAWRAKMANEGPDPQSIEQALLDRLGALEWPRETDIALSLRGRRLLLDVDLPEIEDMPSSRWAANHTQLLLSERALSQKDVAATYLAHVCAIVCRLIGHGFAASDAIDAVGVSGYTQRNGTTGRLEDDYVIVADVTRPAWSKIDVTQIRTIDPENLLRRLGARFEAGARGILKTQEPLT